MDTTQMVIYGLAGLGVLAILWFFVRPRFTVKTHAPHGLKSGGDINVAMPSAQQAVRSEDVDQKN